MPDIRTDMIIKAVAQGFDKVERDIKGLGTAGESAEKGLNKASAGTGALGVALGTLAAGALAAVASKMVDFVKGSISLASSAQETTSLLQNSLGPAADGYVERLDKMAEATNRSSVELQAGSSTIVAMTRSMGFGQEAAANFSATMSQAAVDLGSFFNQSTEQVFQDLQSALAGSAETMLKYGIDVKETALKQAAFNMGLSDGKEVLDRVTRATVLQAEVLRQAADAMGDAERTSDSYENTQRGLQAAVLDLQVAIGESLLPTLTELAVKAGEVVDRLQIATGGLGSYGEQAAETAEKTLEAADSMEELIKSGQKMKDVEGIWFGLGKVVTGTSDEIDAAMVNLSTKIARTADDTIDFQLSIIRAFGSLEELEELVGMTAGEFYDLTVTTESYDKALKNLDFTQKEAASSMARVSDASAELADKYTQANNVISEQELRFREAKKANDEKAESDLAAAEAAEIAAEAQAELTARTADYFDASLPAIESTDKIAVALYEAARAAGADASELAILGVGLGLFSQEQAEAALKAAALQIEIDRLGTLIAGGMGIDEALVLLDEFQARLDRRYEVSLDVQAALDRLNELQNSADVLFAKLAGAGGPEGEGGGTTGGGGTGGNTPYDPGASPSGGNVGMASGGSFTVPPGFPNDSFMVGTTSGERVTVSTPGQAGRGGGNGGGVNVYVTVTGAAAGNPYLTGRQVAGQVANKLGVRG